MALHAGAGHAAHQAGARARRASRPFRASQQPPRVPGCARAAGRPALRCLAAADGSAAAANAPGTAAAGRMTYRPSSYQEMVVDAAKAVSAAIKDGIRRMEVEFPAVPVNIDAYKGSSDLFIDSNVQLAIRAAQQLASEGRKVHLLLPDLAEYSRSYKIFAATLQLTPGVTMGHLKEGQPRDLVANIQAVFAPAAPESAEAGKAADVYIVCNASGVDLPTVEAYAVANAGQGSGKALVAWNLELDTLRGDLGLLGYPPKALQYRFLSTFRPVFFVRTREYSKSVPVAPFLVNYSGALFREYPGPWQVMLKQDSGEYACVAEDSVRYNLGDVKEELMAAMGLNTEEPGSAMAFLRRGYKTATWFEEETQLEQSKEWRL